MKKNYGARWALTGVLSITFLSACAAPGQGSGNAPCLRTAKFIIGCENSQNSGQAAAPNQQGQQPYPNQQPYQQPNQYPQNSQPYQQSAQPYQQNQQNYSNSQSQQKSSGNSSGTVCGPAAMQMSCPSIAIPGTDCRRCQ